MEAPARKRCRATHPTLRFDNGAKVRCHLEQGHGTEHWNSFANRRWES